MEIVTHYSNTPNLLSDLRRTINAVTTMVIRDDEPDIAASAPADRAWRVKERLSPRDLDQLVESFKEGTTIPELVERYGISRTTIRTILRQHGVRRRPKRDPLS